MKWIRPSRISGSLSAPPSKSMTIRGIAAALLAKGESSLINPSWCDDACAGISVAEALGAQIERESHRLLVTGGGPLRETSLDCHESGLCIRMFVPIAALRPERIVLTGTGSLISRPMGMAEAPLHQLGVECQTNAGLALVVVRGPLRSGKATIDGSVSSQFLSGLLFALPLCDGDSELNVRSLKSRPYVSLTLAVMRQFGVSVAAEQGFERIFVKGGQLYRPCSLQVEGDWSGAAFLFVAGALGGKVVVRNLQIQSLQADKNILQALHSTGARISKAEDSISVMKDGLRAFAFDATECPDLFPALVALACHCDGRSTISGLDRLRHKESDRAQALLSEFIKIGARISISGNHFEIEGGRLKGGFIDAHNDHRIAMAGAVAALNSNEGVVISGWECVSKSYPGFFSDLEQIKGERA